ncbi:MFS transporter [Mycolicibacterium smegmatis]|uniref:Putative proline/betaine transporter n=4 Tax=Bacteria TaxID=2 RepID=I7GBD9_MYCS2|nr:MFS transporter [Mycolicibacterium smegmatis]VTP02486.1 Inner membrane metabolite transport protein YhjE [Mycobacterium riyadhense]ABK71506.1 major facilitator family protein transporter [Mycolicibacterium smegmatis MC2 155]AFP40481.1 Major facilitator superfamily MFS_1 [Mycolicibacterium smegmatis MC2 155]AIU09223.1 MFS transporter [Mycolicibacterium smegmatis MC2 155]AIU15848.1 MFS transporter [Mycolicibacterium smegmatis]
MPATPTRPVSMPKVAFASFIGTLIEFFDMFIFSTASALVFNKIFFPSLDPLAGTLAAFAAFGVAFVVRPLGGIVFGHFGDRVGRKTMLVTSLLLMGTGTAAVGVLPTYAQIGIWAPILLVATRLLQGLAIGGEWSGAVLMAVEHAPKSRRAFYGSWPLCGVPGGLVLATIAFYLIGLLPEEQMMSWGWRVPFLASAVLLLIGLYIRLRISESPAFKAVQHNKREAKFPALEVVRSAGKGVVIAILAMAANSVFFYMATVFALSYGERQGASRGLILIAVMCAAAAQIITLPIAAVLADRYGRRPVMIAGCLIGAASAFPIFWLLDTTNFLAILAAMVLAIPVVHSLTYAPMASFISELFETRLRYSGSAMGYQFGSMLWSAPVPFVSAALFAWAGESWPLSVYMFIGTVVSIGAIWWARETFRDEITELDQPSGPAATSSAPHLSVEHTGSSR